MTSMWTQNRDATDTAPNPRVSAVWRLPKLSRCLRMAAVFCMAIAPITGCGPRADLVPDPEAMAGTNSVAVHVGTTRARSPDGLWSRSEPGALNYAVVDISVPPERAPGLVTLPGGRPDPRRDYLTRRIETFPDRAAFQAEARRALAGGRGREEVIVTVHGFNNVMGDGVFRTAQMVADFGIPGPVFHYAWPSRGAPLGYAADRDAVLVARRGLQEMLQDLAAAGAREIVIVAHSMGTQLTMEVLRQMALGGDRATLARLGGVVLMSPDIDPALFREQAEDIGDLPDPFVIFTSREDPALRLSARLTGHADRLGNISTVEEVAGLDVIVIDLSGADDAASRHLAAATSPTMISFLRQTEAVRRGIADSTSGQTGLLPGTVLLAQDATAVMLAPVTALGEGQR
jgi:esterase/lipase superfamily enzyme